VRVAGTISVKTVRSPKIETSYWVAILFSQTLGTALATGWLTLTALATSVVLSSSGQG